MEKNMDLRVVKTERLIKKTFIALMDEIGFSKINVQKIVERAEINRSTFYAHYTDKFDLLDKTENDLLGNLKSIVREAPPELVPPKGLNYETLMAAIRCEVDYMHENGAVFTLLMSEKGDPSFTQKLSGLIQSAWTEEKLVERLSIPQSYAFAALIGMTSSLMAEWVKNGFRETPEEFVQIVSKIVKGIPQNIFH